MNNEDENLCVVCFKSVEIFSVGLCDHPVCFECSTRMRVLCKQNECPICRTDLPDVVFTRHVYRFQHLYQEATLHDEQYGLHFASRSVRDEYLRLMEHNCPICVCLFRTFIQLRDHMRRVHEMHYCDLCVDNLKIFTSERKSYTRAELALHRRKGDEDNTSHRGHPICEFCDQRYMDNDELFRHLRRDHLYCHFCDADGKNQYYADYESLRTHFVDEHFLCEEGECRGELFTSVFRSDIDYRAHVAAVHSRQLTRAAAKQARTLEFEFNFAPRSTQRQSHREARAHQQRRMVAEPLDMDNNSSGSSSNIPVPNLQEQDFPSLTTTSQPISGPSRTSTTFTYHVVKPKFNHEEFPTLGGGGGAAAATVPPKKVSTYAPPKASAARDLRSPTANYTSALALNTNNFPVLAGAGSAPPNPFQEVKLCINSQEATKRSNVSICVNENAPGHSRVSIELGSIEAFPALGGAYAVVPEAKQWGVVKSKKQQQQQEPKVSKVAKAPILPPSSLDEFPKLGKKEKKVSSVVVPMPQNAGAVKKTTVEKKGKGKKVDDNASKVQEVNDNINEIMKKTVSLDIGALGTVPPPGFNDMTFTNSNGESFNISALANNNAEYTYTAPENFQQRNMSLAWNLCQVIDSAAGWTQFKGFSSLFRNGSYAAEKYYEHCRDVLGERFLQLFPELLVLLPDIDKQVELFNLFKKVQSHPKLIKCAICGQVVYVYELADHQDVHSAGIALPSFVPDISGSSSLRRQF